jgi:AcrR family transcriptional regulator
MPYRSTEKTRHKKDAKRTALMQAAVQVFARKGYHAATVRDVVAEAGVAVGTFYFYFPDKETLFTYLYDETAEFLLQALAQSLQRGGGLPRQFQAGLQAYLGLALFEPAVVQLLLLGGAGAVPALTARRVTFRDRLIALWQQPLDEAVDRGDIPHQNTRRAAEALAGGFDEVVLNLLRQPSPEAESKSLVADMVRFGLQAIGYQQIAPDAP